MASDHTTALKGRTYDRTVPNGSELQKHLACRAVPHMNQSRADLGIPIDSERLENALISGTRSGKRLQKAHDVLQISVRARWRMPHYTF